MVTNMRMHVNDNGVYKIMHPETNSNQVLLTGGSTLQNHLDVSIPIRIAEGDIQFLNPESGLYEPYSSDTLAMAPLSSILDLNGKTVNNKATITWSDPSDVTINTSTKTITIAKWKGTKLVMKVGSMPTNENDGVVLVDSTIRSQYSTEGFQVNNLVYDVPHYFKVFPYTEEGVVTNSYNSMITLIPNRVYLTGAKGTMMINGGVAAYLCWTDPEDVIVDGQTVATWAGTKVVMKLGTVAPSSPEDGVLLIDSKVRNKYSTTGTAFKISDILVATSYRVAFFAYTTEGAVTTGNSMTVRRSAKSLPAATAFSVTSNQTTSTIKWKDPLDTVESLPAPVGLTTTAYWKNSKLVRKIGSYPTNVSDGTLLATVTSRDAYATNGFQDSGLIDSSSYYYTLFASSTDDYVSSTNLGTVTILTADDTSGSPGPAKLIAGDKTAGHYGYVPALSLISGSQLASKIGLTAGTAQNDTEGWLKFSLDNKVLFVSQKPFRYNLSWNDINYVNAIDGTKIISINGLSYKLRLLRGLSTTSGNYDQTQGSEWNRLMLPIHIQAVDKSWAYPQFVESTIPNWDRRYTDEQLGTGYPSVQAGTWCQESTKDLNDAKSIRGVSGASHASWATSNAVSVSYGWRPVLELI